MKRLLILIVSTWLCSAAFAQPAGYPATPCAAENATCKVAAPGNLVFGDAKSGKFDAPLHVTADTVCSLLTFGKVDPIYGVVKACFFLADPPPPAPYLVGQVPVTYVPPQFQMLTMPAGASQSIWTAAQAVGCTGPAVGRQWRDAQTVVSTPASGVPVTTVVQRQVWMGSCQKKGYTFFFGQVSDPIQSNGILTIAPPTGFPLEQTQ